MSRNNSSSSRSSMYCHCGYVVSKTRAWTRDNPGRRFYACPDYDAEYERRGCRFFRWYDHEDPVEWQRVVTLDLLDDIKGLMDDNKRLRDEVLKLRKSLEQANQQLRKKEAAVVMLKMKKVEGRSKGFVVSVRGWVVVVVFVVLVIVYFLVKLM